MNAVLQCITSGLASKHRKTILPLYRSLKLWLHIYLRAPSNCKVFHITVLKQALHWTFKNCDRACEFPSSMLWRTAWQVISNITKFLISCHTQPKDKKLYRHLHINFLPMASTIGARVGQLQHTFIKHTAVFSDKIRGSFVETTAKALPVTEMTLLSHHERCPFQWKSSWHDIIIWIVVFFFTEMSGKNLADSWSSLSFFIIIICNIKRKLTAAERFYIHL